MVKVCLYMLVCTCMHMWVCVWKPEVNIRPWALFLRMLSTCLGSEGGVFLFLSACHSGLEFMDQIALAGQQSPGTCLFLTSSRITWWHHGTRHQALLCHMNSWDRAHVPRLMLQALMSCAVSPTVRFCITYLYNLCYSFYHCPSAC